MVTFVKLFLLACYVIKTYGTVINWWEKNEIKLYVWIFYIDSLIVNNISNPDITIHTDASLTSWGITIGVSPSWGLWYKTELEHINVLELKIIEIGIYTYRQNKTFLRKASLALVIWLSLTYPQVPDKAQMNNHQASYLVSICLIFECPVGNAEIFLLWWLDFFSTYCSSASFDNTG